MYNKIMLYTCINKYHLHNYTTLKTNTRKTR